MSVSLNVVSVFYSDLFVQIVWSICHIVTSCRNVVMSYFINVMLQSILYMRSLPLNHLVPIQKYGGQLVNFITCGCESGTPFL
jgi:hypothetical protein